MEASKTDEAITHAVISAVRTAHHAISSGDFADAVQEVECASANMVESMFADDVRRLVRFAIRTTADLIMLRADRGGDKYFYGWTIPIGH